MRYLKDSAFWLAGLIGALGLIIGHYFLQRPRPVIEAPITYMYGVGWWIVAMRVYKLLTGKNEWPWWLSVGFFVVMGAGDVACYIVDALVYRTKSRKAIVREVVSGGR